MSNKIKINTIIISQDSNNIKNINNTVFPLKYKRQPEPKKTPTLDNSSNKNTTILNNTSNFILGQNRNTTNPTTNNIILIILFLFIIIPLSY